MTSKKEFVTTVRRRLSVVGFVMLSVALVASGSFGVLAQNLQELQSESAEIRSEMEQASEEVVRLREQATDLEEAIEELDEQIEESSKEIERISTVIDELQDELDIAQANLEAQQALLRANMRTLYKRGGVSTVELLAASESFSEFIDEQEYLERLKGSIQDSTRAVYDIRQAIKRQQTEQKELLIQQEGIAQSLNDLREERRRLLDGNRDEQERLWEYTQSLAERQRQINQELIRMSHIVTTEGTGGYPWANALCAYTDLPVGPCRHPTDSWGDFEWYVNDRNNRRDKWEFFYRNCTSYVAWRSAQDGFELTPLGPGRSGLGDAGSWHTNASRYDKLSVGNEPKVASFAVFANGPFGHVAYVERIAGDRVLVSEYNLFGDGAYSERWIPRYQPTAYVYPPHAR